MAQNNKTVDPNTEMLSAIHRTIQDLLILEGAKAGMGKADVRKIVGVADARVSRIWKSIRISQSKNH